jgi:TRAP-type uncharacterized transport system substrate-binding protein
LALGALGTTRVDAAVETSSQRVVELETGGTDGAAVRMAEDLARLLDEDGTRRLLAVMGKGSLQTLSDLRGLRGIDLAIVHTDLLENARTQKPNGDVEARFTYVAKLHNEEFHLLAHDDVRRIEDLAGKKVAVDGRDSATAFTAARVFERLGLEVETVFDDRAVALEKLRRGEIAAMAYVAAKPTPLLAELRAEDRLHLVPVPLKQNLTTLYAPSRLTTADYPALVAADAPVDTIAVGTVMLAANLPAKSERYRNVADMVDAFFTRFPTLLEPGHHAKWQEVNLAADLPGWRRFGPAETWLKRNQAAAPVALGDTELKDIFSRFLDERNKVAGGGMTQQQKDELFEQFRRWQNGQQTSQLR